MSAAEKNQNLKDALLDLLGQSEKVVVADVVRSGEKIILPKGMKTDTAIKTLQRQLQYDNEVVEMVFDFDYFVWDGAHALAKVMEKRYGFVFGKTVHTFFGSYPPQLVAVEVGMGKTVQVPWGQFTAPSVSDSVFICNKQIKDGKMNFRFTVKCKHMYEDEMRKLEQEVREYLAQNSIYKGKAISIRFTDDKGKSLLDLEQIPTPRFLDLSKLVEEDLVFSESVGEAIDTNLFTILEKPDLARRTKIPIKRGILLAGDFGVGKTLTAYVAAQKAVKSNFTYVYCEKPEEFTHIMRFATQYAPALVFCEDVDRIVGLERDNKVDTLINIIDGVETKNTEIITVFTTNLVKNVNPALLRPGRMDAVIPILRPDSAAVQQLIWNYCGDFLEKDVDLTEVGELLADNLPSVIREVCERSKLSALRFIEANGDLKVIPVKALREAAKTMKMQLDLLNNREKAPLDPPVQAQENIAAGLFRIAEAVAISGGHPLPEMKPVIRNADLQRQLAEVSSHKG